MPRRVEQPATLFSIPAALLRLTFSAAAKGVTGPRGDPLCDSKTGRARRGRTIYAAMKGAYEMSDQTERNIEVVKKGIEAFSTADIETMMSLFDDNIEWVQPGDSAISGTYHGKGELGQFFRRLAPQSATIGPAASSPTATWSSCSAKRLLATKQAKSRMSSLSATAR